jgi:hypothetical protein
LLGVLLEEDVVAAGADAVVVGATTTRGVEVVVETAAGAAATSTGVDEVVVVGTGATYTEVDVVTGAGAGATYTEVLVEVEAVLAPWKNWAGMGVELGATGVAVVVGATDALVGSPPGWTQTVEVQSTVSISVTHSVCHSIAASRLCFW